MRIELSYDGAGNRLRRIGDFQISYDKLGTRAKALGGLGLEYDMAGNRVRRIGGLTVDYDKLGSRPRYLRADGDQLLDEKLRVIVFLVLVAFRRA